MPATVKTPPTMAHLVRVSVAALTPRYSASRPHLHLHEQTSCWSKLMPLARVIGTLLPGGGRHSKDVDKPRRGGLTPLAKSSPL